VVYYFTPYSIEKNLGEVYSNYMSLIPNDDDWGCLLDADTMFLTPNFGHQIQDIINKYQNDNVGLFTCYTNRIGNLEQCYRGQISEDSDIKNHKKIALEIQKSNYDKVKPLNHFISGHLMIIQKKVWKTLEFDKKGLLAIDNKISYRVLRNGYKILLMEGVYIFHYYRLIEGRLDKSHLK